MPLPLSALLLNQASLIPFIHTGQCMSARAIEYCLKFLPKLHEPFRRNAIWRQGQRIMRFWNLDILMPILFLVYAITHMVSRPCIAPPGITTGLRLISCAPNMGSRSQLTRLGCSYSLLWLFPTFLPRVRYCSLSLFIAGNSWTIAASQTCLLPPFKTGCFYLNLHAQVSISTLKLQGRVPVQALDYLLKM